ncbi:metalloregulator ArsR/SmtB family transcription factor [Pseudomonas sp. EL_65y_Pfl2_R95]|uniref:metalloregulator ArsR/SmtB family transcription factor n=1 Tax=Pseudomonas sp. EL_65y_Pfl2_R95 TaxID=3088698 RepID=UPI0030D95B53
MAGPFKPTEVFRCLADDTRARITLLIASEGELCVCELTAALEQSQPKISRHLALLRTCGLLMDRRQGQWVYYRLHPELPGWVTSMLREVAESHAQWLSDDATRLGQMKSLTQNQSLCD